MRSEEPHEAEFALIKRLSPYFATGPGIVVPAGDDAAVLDPGTGHLVLSVDTVVEGRHFTMELSSYADVGWKAVAAATSDLAAMGAAPRALLVSLSRPSWMSPDAVIELYEGIAEASREWGLSLAGGDTVAAGELAIGVTVFGTVDPGRAVTWAGARPGDQLVLLGTLGAAAAALAAHAAGRPPAPQLLAAHQRPRALVKGGLAFAQCGARAMIDLSDGLGADAGHLCAASGVQARLDADALLVADGVAEVAAELGLAFIDLVVGGGEDYALLAALPPEAAEIAVVSASGAEGCPAAVIGEILDAGPRGPDVMLFVPGAPPRSISGAGYEHQWETQ